MRILNSIATLLAVCAATKVKPVYEITVQEGPERVESIGPLGAEQLANLDELLKDVPDHVRAEIDLAPHGSVQYVSTKDSVKAALEAGDTAGWRQQERNANFIRHNAQGMAFAEENDFYATAQSFKETSPDNFELEGNPYPNVIVFPEGGIGRDGVAAAVLKRLLGLPDQSFWESATRRGH